MTTLNRAICNRSFFNLVVYSRVQRDGDTMSRSTNDLGLVVLRIPVAAVLDPIKLLEDEDH